MPAPQYQLTRYDGTGQPVTPATHHPVAISVGTATQQSPQPTEIQFEDGSTLNISHSYSAPYERNDLILKLQAEQNISTSFYSSESTLMPDLFLTLYADIDFEYNYYNKQFEDIRELGFTTTNGATDFSVDFLLPNLNLFLQYDTGLYDISLPIFSLSSADVFYGTMTLFGAMPSHSDAANTSPPSGLARQDSTSTTTFSAASSTPPDEIYPYNLYQSHTFFSDTANGINYMFDYLHNEPSSENLRMPLGGTAIAVSVSQLKVSNPSSTYARIQYAMSGLANRNTYGERFLDKHALGVLRDDKNKRENFPFFAKIKLEGESTSAIANKIEKLGISELFCNFLFPSNEYWTEYLIPSGGDTIASGAIPYIKTVESAVVDLGIVKTYVYRFADFSRFVTDSSTTTGNGTCDMLEALVFSQVLGNWITEYVDSKDVGHSEVVAWVVKKYAPNDKDALPEELSKYYYFLNYEDVSNFCFYDTQVRYDVKYKYEIKAINALIASTDGVSTTTHDAWEAEGATYIPSGGKELLLIEEPFYSENIRIIDSPPLSPEVNMVTYRGIDNQVLIMFNSRVGKELNTPVNINESDQQTYLTQYTAQNRTEGSTIIFESDDPPEYFEIFKTTEKPTSYSQFRNISYRTVATNGNYSAAYTDIIVPNQVYYYAFRTLDVHGFPSNPTEIYEFVMLKDGETIYPRIRVLSDLGSSKSPFQKSKSFKRFLKISPSLQQLRVPTINKTSFDDLTSNHYIYGGADSLFDTQTIFEKTYKFRIKSKNTGKIIDINVKFTEKGVIIV